MFNDHAMTMCVICLLYTTGSAMFCTLASLESETHHTNIDL
jgi:hypothetical protein